MAKEIGASKRVQFLLANKVFHHNEYTVKGEDWELKIAAYSDQRIGPFGVLSLQERFKELKERYAKRENKNVNHPKIDIFIICAFEIEKQLFSHVSLTENQINDVSIKRYIEEYAKSNE